MNLLHKNRKGFGFSIMRTLIAAVAMMAAAFCCYANNIERNTAKEKLEQCYQSYNEGNWIETLSSLHDFLRKYEDAGEYENSIDCAKAYMLLSRVHIAYSDYANAEKYFQKALALAQLTGNESQKLKLFGNLAVSYCQLGEEAKARQYLDSISKSKITDRNSRLFTYHIADAYIERIFGNWERAVGKMKHVIHVVDSAGLGERSKASPVSEITEMYEEHNRLDSAMHYLRRYEALARQGNVVDMLTECQRLYMRIYTKRGEVDSALKYQDLYFRMKDSLMNHRNFLNLAGKFEHENERKASDRIQSLTFKVGQQHMALIIGCTGLLIVIAIAVVLVIQKRKLRASYTLLFEKNKELEKLERQQEQPPSAPVVTPVMESLKQKILAVMNDGKEWLDPDFSLTRLAELTESNTRYVSQVINDCFNKNFRTFINEYRVREACAMMADTEKYGNLTIQSIGENVGFRSASNFIAAFKKQTGLTPSFYQQMSNQREKE